jgi:hypothetical protein
MSDNHYDAKFGVRNALENKIHLSTLGRLSFDVTERHCVCLSNTDRLQLSGEIIRVYCVTFETK